MLQMIANDVQIYFSDWNMFSVQTMPHLRKLYRIIKVYLNLSKRLAMLMNMQVIMYVWKRYLSNVCSMKSSLISWATGENVGLDIPIMSFDHKATNL